MKSPPILLAIGLLLMGIDRSAATDVPPGGMVVLTGYAGDKPEWFGTVVSDDFLPFEIRNGANTVILSGTVQDRIVESNVTGTVIPSPLLRDLAAPTGSGRIVALRLNGYAGVTVDADYKLPAGGTPPTSISRSTGSGDQLECHYDPVPLVPPGDSVFIKLLTNAPGYSRAGSITIVAKDGASGPQFSTTLANTVAPVLFDPDEVPILSFRKTGTNEYTLRFLAKVRTYYRIYSAPSPAGPWTYRYKPYRSLSPAEITIHPYEPSNGHEFYRLEPEDP